jgi:hypothetical protein
MGGSAGAVGIDAKDEADADDVAMGQSDDETEADDAIVLLSTSDESGHDDDDAPYTPEEEDSMSLASLGPQHRGTAGRGQAAAATSPRRQSPRQQSPRRRRRASGAVDYRKLAGVRNYGDGQDQDSVDEASLASTPPRAGKRRASGAKATRNTRLKK